MTSNDVRKRMEMKRFVVRWTLSSLGLILLTACTYVGVKAYQSPRLLTTPLNSIAVLPFQDAELGHQTALELNRRIVQALTERNPALTIVDEFQSQDDLSASGLTGEYSQFLRDYRDSRKLNKAVLAKLGDTLGTDAILQGDIAQLVQRDGFPFDNAAYTKLVLRYSIFSLRSGVLLWESSATARKETTAFNTAPKIEELIPAVVGQVTFVMNHTHFR